MAEAEQQEKRHSRLSFVRELVVLVLTALVLAVGIKTFVAQAFYIPSGSMSPQLGVNDRIVVSKLSYRLHDPRRGDIVVFDSPTPVPEPERPLPQRLVRGLGQALGVTPPSTNEFVKRVIALPGERVEARGGKVYVDGREVVEPYLPEGTVTSDFSPVAVPEGSVWVMGDNRTNSADSRVFGAIPESTIVGRAIVRVWPLPDASFL
ncbi:MAG TPA: signal peptidase I [Acidimicrobiales bacterium]|nr:signal peptidase I [Acidimicrobiales bacterium]